MCHVCNHNKKIIAKNNIADKAVFLNKIKEMSLPYSDFNPSNSKASLIVYGGQIITLDEHHKTKAEAIAVSNDRIIAVGDLDFIIKHFKQDSTQLLNLNGKTLVPGFIDPHLHVVLTAMVANFITISQFTYKTPQSVRDIIEYHVKQAHHGAWVAFQGIDPELLENQIDLSIQELDKLAPHNPIIIMHDSMHMAYLNSAAFEAAKIDKNTPSPKGGEFIKDAKGELTGLIIEEPAITIFLKYVIKITPEQYVQAIIDIFHYANQMGCTSVHDAAIGILDLNLDIAAISAAISQAPILRLSAFIFTKNLEDLKKSLALEIFEFNRKFFRIVGFKAVLDGSTQIGTAAFHDKYSDNRYDTGHLNYDQNEINEMITLANKNNWQYGVHANGDLAIDMALTAFETSNKNNQKKNIRNRIEHCSFCNQDQFTKMAELHVSPTFLIAHVYYWGKICRKLLGNKRAELLDSCKTAIDHNLTISLHSDYSVSPINPLMSMHIAVNRYMFNSDDQLNKNECISPLEALKSITINAAWQCQTEDIVGSISVGKLADFVILDHNPLTIDKTKIKDIQVLQTWVGGKKVYSKI